jgi:CheY-like chemotaxis protein
MDGSTTPRVFLVDDEPRDRGVLSRLLNAAGFVTRHAEDGIDGLAKLRETLPDIIISDLGMPRMSGAEFISVVRRRLPHIPVIVISGGLQPEQPARDFRPDVWLGRGSLRIEELVKSIPDLIRQGPSQLQIPEPTDTPFRVQHDGVGDFVVPCTDCLRPLKISDTPEIRSGEQRATCVHCQARVRFFVDDSDPS